MPEPVKPAARPYHAPRRAAAAARTRQAIMTAAKDAFERLGWPGTTMRGVAGEAGVSVKTVEALYRTKAELLKHVVDYAIAGDLDPVPISGREAAVDEMLRIAPSPRSAITCPNTWQGRIVPIRLRPTAPSSASLGRSKNLRSGAVVASGRLPPAKVDHYVREVYPPPVAE